MSRRVRRGKAESGSGEPDRAAIARQLQRAVGSLATSTLTRMERDMPWFRELPAQDRSWIGLIVQAGIKSFVAWYEEPDGTSSPVTAEIFGAAPRALAGVVSLHQTVEMVRLTIEVVEENVVDAVGEADAPSVRDSIVRYAREVAFATAEVYARAAEMRGAWDARLEALVVDSVLRAEADETVRSRASALGWESRGDVAVVLGRVPDTDGLGTASRSSTTYDAPHVTSGSTHSAPSRATGWSSCSAASTTRTRPAPRWWSTSARDRS